MCYIYSILNKENLDKVSDEKLLKYKKKISRILYKLNKGISKIETEEFKNNNTDYYDENITDISVSSVLSLYIFINIIKEKADMIKGVPYLPLRYISRDNALDNITDDNRIRKDISNRNINVSIPEYVDYDDTKDSIINKSKFLRRELDNIVIKGTY